MTRRLSTMIVLMAVMALLQGVPASGAPPAQRRGQPRPASKPPPPSSPTPTEQPSTPTTPSTPAPAKPPADKAPAPVPVSPQPTSRQPSSSGIEGTYNAAGSAAEIRVRRISGDLYYLASAEGWEGVGILDGSTYRGVFRYHGDHDPQMSGVMGQHTIDWSTRDDPSVQATYTALRTGHREERWHRLSVPSERPTEKPSASTSPPPTVIVTPPDDGKSPGDGLAPGDYVYVEELPEAIVKVPPSYPPKAREAGIEGKVTVQALVLKDGSVGECRVVQSVPELDEAAVACVRQWRFKPALSKGAPVAVWVAVPVGFTLH